MWRPEDWDNPYKMRVSTDDASKWADNLQDIKLEAYEAGADAMLQALREQPSPNLGNMIIATTLKGHLVFIPDEEIIVVNGSKYPTAPEYTFPKGFTPHLISKEDGEKLSYQYVPCYGTHGNQGTPHGECPLCHNPLYITP